MPIRENLGNAAIHPTSNTTTRGSAAAVRYGSEYEEVGVGMTPGLAQTVTVTGITTKDKITSLLSNPNITNSFEINNTKLVSGQTVTQYKFTVNGETYKIRVPGAEGREFSIHKAERGFRGRGAGVPLQIPDYSHVRNMSATSGEDIYEGNNFLNDLLQFVAETAGVPQITIQDRVSSQQSPARPAWSKGGDINYSVLDNAGPVPISAQPGYSSLGDQAPQFAYEDVPVPGQVSVATGQFPLRVGSYEEPDASSGGMNTVYHVPAMLRREGSYDEPLGRPQTYDGGLYNVPIDLRAQELELYRLIKAAQIGPRQKPTSQLAGVVEGESSSDPTQSDTYDSVNYLVTEIFLINEKQVVFQVVKNADDEAVKVEGFQGDYEQTLQHVEASLRLRLRNFALESGSFGDDFKVDRTGFQKNGGFVKLSFRKEGQEFSYKITLKLDEPIKVTDKNGNLISDPASIAQILQDAQSIREKEVTKEFAQFKENLPAEYKFGQVGGGQLYSLYHSQIGSELAKFDTKTGQVFVGDEIIELQKMYDLLSKLKKLQSLFQGMEPYLQMQNKGNIISLVYIVKTREGKEIPVPAFTFDAKTGKIKNEAKQEITFDQLESLLSRSGENPAKLAGNIQKLKSLRSLIDANQDIIESVQANGKTYYKIPITPTQEGLLTKKNLVHGAVGQRFMVLSSQGELDPIRFVSSEVGKTLEFTAESISQHRNRLMFNSNIYDEKGELSNALDVALQGVLKQEVLNVFDQFRSSFSGGYKRNEGEIKFTYATGQSSGGVVAQSLVLKLDAAGNIVQMTALEEVNGVVKQSTAMNLEEFAGLSRAVLLGQQNKEKQRYPNILVKPETAVTIGEGGFIHANYVKFGGQEPGYILAQGPMSRDEGKVETRGDMLQMLFEQRASSLFCASELQEGSSYKFSNYLPEVGRQLSFQGYQIKRLSKQEFGEKGNGADGKPKPYLEYSIIEITDQEGQKHTMPHFWVRNMPDHQGQDAGDFLKLMAFAKGFEEKFWEGKDQPGPCVAHCSAGVGRSSMCVAAQHILTGQAQSNPIFKVIGQQRLKAPQTQSQIKSIVLMQDHFLEVGQQDVLKNIESEGARAVNKLTFEVAAAENLYGTPSNTPVGSTATSPAPAQSQLGAEATDSAYGTPNVSRAPEQLVPPPVNRSSKPSSPATSPAPAQASSLAAAMELGGAGISQA